MEDVPNCIACPGKFCVKKIYDRRVLPDFCPIVAAGELIEEAKGKYSEDDVGKLYRAAALTEKEAYEVVRGTRMAVRPRIREIAEFSKLLGYEKLGIAFCGGLVNEASRASKILNGHGFKIYSAICSCGAIDKTELGVPEEHKIAGPGLFEPGCNPLLQAELLNRAGTDLNIIVGLCIGHDILFTKHSKAPVTTLIVKDRLTGHNPVISLYSNYHRNIV